MTVTGEGHGGTSPDAFYREGSLAHTKSSKSREHTPRLPELDENTSGIYGVLSRVRVSCRLFGQSLEAGMVAERGQVGVIPHPDFLKRGMGDGPFQALDGLLRVPQQGIDTGHIVKHLGLLRFHRQRSSGPL
jgi:hypothetical protein